MRATAVLGVLAMLAETFAADPTPTEEPTGIEAKFKSLSLKYTLQVADPMLPLQNENFPDSAAAENTTTSATSTTSASQTSLATSTTKKAAHKTPKTQAGSHGGGDNNGAAVNGSRRRKRRASLTERDASVAGPDGLTPRAPHPFEFSFQGRGVSVVGIAGGTAGTWQIDGHNVPAGDDSLLVQQSDLSFGDHAVSYSSRIDELARVEIETEVFSVDFNEAGNMRCDNFKLRAEDGTLKLGDKADVNAVVESQKLENQAAIEIDIPEMATLITLNGSTTEDSGTYEAMVVANDELEGIVTGTGARPHPHNNRMFYIRTLQPWNKYKFKLALTEDKPLYLESMRICYATKAKKANSNARAIGGGVVGGVVSLALIGAAVYFCMRRRRHQQRRDASRAAYFRSDSLPSLADSPELAKKNMLEKTPVTDNVNSDRGSGKIACSERTLNWVADMSSSTVSPDDYAPGGAQALYSAPRTSLLDAISSSAARPDSTLLGLQQLATDGAQPNIAGYGSAPPLSRQPSATSVNDNAKSSAQSVSARQASQSTDTQSSKTTNAGIVPPLPVASPNPSAPSSIGSRQEQPDLRVSMPGFVPRRPSVISNVTSVSSDGDTDETSPIRTKPRRPRSAARKSRGKRN